MSFDGAGEPPPRRAFFGVRSCELAAIALQDRVLMGGPTSIRSMPRAARLPADRGQLHRSRGDLLLRLARHGPARRARASTSR